MKAPAPRAARAATGRTLLPFYAAGLLVALSLKAFYSRAGADALDWALAPTAWLVDRLAGIAFEREPGAGWISHTHRMILAPACAGLNFLIIAFAMIFLSFVHRLRGAAARLAWLGASLGAAGVLALGVNAARVVAAVRLRESGFGSTLFTPEQVHRAEGTAICCVSLLLVYLVIERLFERRAARGAVRNARGGWTASPLVPAAWYLGVTLGLPVLDRAYRRDAGLFAEHAIWVVSITLGLALAAMMLRPGLRAAAAMMKTPRARW